MEKMNDLRDLLKHEIQDLYSVEEQIIEALPKMAEKANNKALKNALNEHLKVTEEHKNRLDKIQQMMNKGEESNGKKKGFLSNLFGGKHTCKGMEGIIEEGNKILSADISPQTLDAAIIACTQKVEHYEICGYGTARTYARELNLDTVTKLLEQTLKEEYEADKRLTELAVQRINVEAESTKTDQSRSAKGRTAKGASTERINREERVMEPVSNRSGAKSTNTTRSGSERSGQPRAAAAPRSSGGRRETPASGKTASNSSTAKASAKRTSTGNGRSSTGRGNSRSKRG